MTATIAGITPFNFCPMTRSSAYISNLNRSTLSATTLHRLVAGLHQVGLLKKLGHIGFIDGGVVNIHLELKPAVVSPSSRDPAGGLFAIHKARVHVVHAQPVVVKAGHAAATGIVRYAMHTPLDVVP